MKLLFFDSSKIFGWQVITAFLVACLFVALIVMALFNWRVTSKEYLADLISRDISTLASIIERIDKDCKILSFDYQKNKINFLTVKTFVSSEVGPLNLAYQDKWKGPYLDDNPSYQGKNYILVKTKQGYFVTPAEDVTLPNGNIIGKDIMLDENADIDEMIKNEKQLRFNNKPLAVKLKLSTSTAPALTQLPLERI